LQASRVQLRAVVTDARASADDNVHDSGATILDPVSPDAHTTAKLFSTASVTLDSQASVRGSGSVDIQARHDGINTSSDALSTDFGVSIFNDATADNIQQTSSLVTAQANALVETRQLTVTDKTNVNNLFTRSRRDGDAAGLVEGTDTHSN